MMSQKTRFDKVKKNLKYFRCVCVWTIVIIRRKKANNRQNDKERVHNTQPTTKRHTKLNECECEYAYSSRKLKIWTDEYLNK